MIIQRLDSLPKRVQEEVRKSYEGVATWVELNPDHLDNGAYTVLRAWDREPKQYFLSGGVYFKTPPTDGSMFTVHYSDGLDKVVENV